MCDSCVVIADIYASSRRKKSTGLFTIDRLFDCLFCGPWSTKTETSVPPTFMDSGQTGEWTHHKFTRVYQPAKKIQAPRGRVKQSDGYKNP